MASLAPFSRRQWASQSLRVTAKELSIVNARGKNNAIAERFSKYQMAAEEGNAEKKKMVSEPVSPTLRSGNLSVLKKRWEQQQQQSASSHKAQTQENVPSRPSNPATIPAGHQPDASKELTEPRSDVQYSSALSQGEDRDPETHPAISQYQAAEAEDLNDMEASKDSQGLERAAAEVPECEKPSVPLNSLKMMFEKGENLSDQVSREQTMEQIMGDGSLVDSTPLRDRMALYQAAISKQDVNNDQLDSFCGKQKENVPPFSLDMSPESEPNGRKVFSAESNGSSPGTPSNNQKDSSQPRTPRNFQLPIRETCVSCQKTVYPLERLVANQSIYHSSCFRCFHCNSKLSLVNYASLHNSVYCKPHFNQLFKAKGNYDEGFGHRPHKELWETKDESGESSPQSNDQTKAQVHSSSSASDLDSPSVEDSPLAKVNVLMATMEALGQGTPDKTDRPAEARRLKISWPPRTESEEGTATVTEGGAAGKLTKAKWPPEEELHSPVNEHAEEISCLRRSSSLKERSMPFTLAKQSEESPAPQARSQSPPPPVEEEQLLSPGGSSMELQHGMSLTEDSCVDLYSSSGEETEVKEQQEEEEEELQKLQQEVEEEEQEQQQEEEVEEEMTSEDAPDNQVTPEEDEETLGGEPEQQEEEEEKMEEEDGGALDEMSAEPTAISPHEEEVEESRSPQDVGFWDGEEVDDKEEPQQVEKEKQEEEEALTVEEMIKRNRYYEDEEEEEEEDV